MIQETIPLFPERQVTLTVCRHEDSKEFQTGILRPMVIICPGGGYSFLSDRESDPVAVKYLAAGFHTAILRYGIGEFAEAPGPLRDIAAAVKHVKEHANDWKVNPDWVYVAGFSAGAHVACQLGVFWKNSELLPEYEDCREMIRPAGMILSYPVIDLTKSATHMDIGLKPGQDVSKVDFSQKHPKMPLDQIFVPDPKEGRCFVNFEKAMNAFIFGGEYTDEQEAFYSLQNQVTEDTCPAFIWHCMGDGLILPANSLELATALNEHGVSAELHLYAGGGHGISLADYPTLNDSYQDYPYASDWMEHSIRWLLKSSGYEQQIRDRMIILP